MASAPSPQAPPDRDLLRAACGGDLEAFAALYGRYQHVVYRFARAMTGCADAAEDVTQDVFVALIADLPRYDASRAAFGTYLYGIVRNLSRDRLRRERRRLSLHGLSLIGSEPSYVADPAGGLEDAQRAAAVRRALGKLPSRYRELIILCDLHGLSYSEAAAVVGTSVPAVRSRLHRGRHLLRLRLGHVAVMTPSAHMHPARCAI
jgi:RNA polymerase sigma-70 factor (ECF subfamily)